MKNVSPTKITIDQFFPTAKRKAEPHPEQSPLKKIKTTPPSQTNPATNNLIETLHNEEWLKALTNEFKKPYFSQLARFIESEREEYTIYPNKTEIFTAYNICPLSKIKVVILGQDPYHGPNQAHGLSFSVKKGFPAPPSLRTIFKELGNDINGFTKPKDGNLEHWAEQGVFLLNTVLTVREGKANSHAKKGWETYTDETITQISNKLSGVVFLLWGANAQKKSSLINEGKHLILKAAHPSPLSSKAFVGCHHFSQTNEYLIKNGKDPIDWLL